MSEISEITGISRQGVRDAIKKGEEEIRKLEEKLSVQKKEDRYIRFLENLKESITSLSGCDKEKLNDINSSIERMLDSFETD